MYFNGTFIASQNMTSLGFADLSLVALIKFFLYKKV